MKNTSKSFYEKVLPDSFSIRDLLMVCGMNTSSKEYDMLDQLIKEGGLVFDIEKDNHYFIIEEKMVEILKRNPYWSYLQYIYENYD